MTYEQALRDILFWNTVGMWLAWASFAGQCVLLILLIVKAMRERKAKS